MTPMSRPDLVPAIAEFINAEVAKGVDPTEVGVSVARRWPGHDSTDFMRAMVLAAEIREMDVAEQASEALAKRRASRDET